MQNTVVAVNNQVAMQNYNEEQFANLKLLLEGIVDKITAVQDAIGALDEKVMSTVVP